MKKRGAKKQNKFSLKENYLKSWNYLKESRNFIWIIIILFFLTALIGFFFQAPENLSNEILNLLEELVEKTSGMNQFQLIRFIFLNNLQSSFTGMLFGIIFGIFPLIGSLANGYILGFVSKIAVSESGFYSLLNLLPHGIFELPAIFISLGMGLKLGTLIFQKNKEKSFKKFLWNSIRVFILIVIPLLIIAGIIEGTLIYIIK